MHSGFPRYILRRERTGGHLFDRLTGSRERIGEGNYILLERAHNLGTGASGVRRFVADSFADERTAEAFLNDCVRRGILDENKASSLQIINAPLPPDRLPIVCHSAPSRLFWQITDRGPACSTGDSPHEVSLDKAKKIIKKVAEAGTFELWFCRCEPTDHPFFPGIVTAAKEQGLFVTVETHATFDESTRNKMFSSMVDRFAVIVAGSATTHNALFGDGAFRKMIEFVSRLSQRGEKLATIVMPFGKNNADKLKDAIGMTKQVRGEELFVVPMGGKGKLPLKEFFARINEAAELAEGLGVLISTPADLLGGKNLTIAGCPAGISDAVLDQDGMLRACRYCDADSEPSGDILELGYISLWLDHGRFGKYRDESPACRAGERLFG